MRRVWTASLFLSCLWMTLATAAVADIQVPTWKDDPIDLGLINEGTPIQIPLKDWVRADSTDVLEFSGQQLPTWLKLETTTGLLSGTPQRADVGDFTDLQLTVQGKTGKSSVAARITVKKVVKTASWISKDFTLSAANEDSAFSVSLGIPTYLDRGDAEVVEFALGSPAPAWLSLSPNGLLFGIPARKDVGAVVVSVVAKSKTSNGIWLSSTTTFRFDVKAVNHAPVWKQAVLVLPIANTLKAYRQSLSAAVMDSDPGDSLTFQGVDAPNWMRVQADGTLEGIPARMDAGVAKFSVRVTDAAGASAVGQLQLTILRSNEAPGWTKPMTLPGAKEGEVYQIDLSQFASDPDSDRLYFARVDDGRPWLQVMENGALIGTPSRADVGPMKLRLKVEDRISGAEVVETAIFVDKAASVPVWKLDPIVISASEDQPLQAELAAYATDSDHPTGLTFAKTGGADWVTVAPTGALRGTPGAREVGDHFLTVKATNPAGASAETNVLVRVVHVNHAPTWTQSPIVLPNAEEGVAYIFQLKDKAKDPDAGDVLIFEKASLEPKWLTVDADGTLRGTPWKTDAGTVLLSLRVRDQAQASAVVQASITVVKASKAPRWRANPVPLGDIYAGVISHFDLSPYAIADAGQKVTFSLVEGPRWMTISPEGIVSMQPLKADVGAVRAVFRAATGTLTSDANAVGDVKPRGQGPVISSTLPTWTVRVGETFRVDLNQPIYVTDPDGGKLEFRLTSVTDWANISLDGKFEARPSTVLGEQKLEFTVSNGVAATTGVLSLHIVAAAAGPVWTQNPIPLRAKTFEAFSSDLAAFVRDATTLKPTFSKVRGPEWLSVSNAGKISGTPIVANLGNNVFTIQACVEGNLCSPVQVNISVEAGAFAHSVSLGDPLAGARGEWIWLVDNSPASAELIRNTKQAAKGFHDALRAAKIDFRSIVLSNEAYRWDGNPIPGEGNRLFFGDNSSDVDADFRTRIDYTYVEQCTGCVHSPIWSLWRFLSRLQDFGSLYPAHFLGGSLPMEVVVLSPRVDQFRWYTRSNPQLASLQPSDFAASFKKFFSDRKIPLRVHALAPECPTLAAGEGAEAPATENAYRVLSEATGGQVFGDKCQIDVPAALSKLAELSAPRARLFALSMVRLSRYPNDPTQIEVRLGGKAIDRKAADGTDVWTYDATANAIKARWDRVNLDTITNETRLEIRFEPNPAQE